MDIPEFAFERLVNCLRMRVGEESAITLDDLALSIGLVETVTDPSGAPRHKPMRRHIEHLVETRLQDIPFVVCAGSRGYYRPDSAEDLNRYYFSLRSRIKSIAVRLRTVRRKAAASGYSLTGRRFVQYRDDLFPVVEVCKQRGTR